MTTPFTTYSFSATAPTPHFPRTTPDRLNDVFNVKDFGAVGDGKTDDTAAIRAAIVYAYSQNQVSSASGGGIVFFPPGVYYIGSPPLDVSNDAGPQAAGAIMLSGASRASSVLKGNYTTGWLLELINGFNGRWAGVSGIRNLTIENDSTTLLSGAFRIQYLIANEFYAENCKFVGYNAVIGAGDTELSTSFRNCIFSYPGFRDANGNETSNFYPANGSGLPANSSGLGYCGGACIACYAEGFDKGFILNGNAISVYSNRAYRCNEGFHLIADAPFLVDTLLRFPRQKSSPIMGNVWDRCFSGFSSPGGATGMSVVANRRSGIDGPKDPAVISTITRSGTTATATTALNHGLGSNPQWLLLRTTPSDWTPDHSGTQMVLCTPDPVLLNVFTYTLPGAPGSSSANGTWNYPPQWGIIPKSTHHHFFAANSLPAQVANYSFADLDSIDGATTGESEYINTVMATEFPYQCLLPKVDGAAQWRYEQCINTGGTSLYSFMTYAAANSNVSWAGGGKYEGREYNITDGQKSGGGTAGFGDVVAGGGSGHYKVRRTNAGNWIRIG